MYNSRQVYTFINFVLEYRTTGIIMHSVFENVVIKYINKKELYMGKYEKQNYIFIYVRGVAAKARKS